MANVKRPTMGQAKEEEVKEVVSDPVSVEPEQDPDVEEGVLDPYADEPVLRLEDVDPAEELWQGGPTVGDALKWKEEYGTVIITSLTMEKHLMWRPLFRGEYLAVSKEMERLASTGETTPIDIQFRQEELICEICLLAPRLSGPDFERDLAGLPSMLSQQILETSGFSVIDTREL